MKLFNVFLKPAILAVLMISFTGCEKEELNEEIFEVNASVKAKPPTAEKVGNNLSFPVIWSDGVTKALRGTYGEESFTGLYFTVDNSNYYVQNDPGNIWQAESFNPITAELGNITYPIDDLKDVSISSIDWGDNLEAKDWPFGAQIRVEVVLYKHLLNSMKAYTMKMEDESQSGLTEVWGAKTEDVQDGPLGITYLSDSATVYSGMAKLVIQKIDDMSGNETPMLIWNLETSSWVGDVSTPLFEGAVWDNVDGPSGYSAEINVQGKVIYGYNWVTRKIGDGAGTYRLTFVLDNQDEDYVGEKNTFITDATQIVTKVEEEEIIPAAEPESGGGTAVVDHLNNLTYIDVQLVAKSGSGGGNSGVGGGNGGNQGGKGGGRN